MTKLDHALSQLEFIQDRFAASTRFRGFAPGAVALTGLLAVALAAAQAAWPATVGGRGSGFVVSWVIAAVIAAALVGTEALGRSRRLHGGMADKMIAGTLRLLLPFGAVGAVITWVIVRIAPDTIWLLPGLWQLLVALIGFASVSTLPRTIVWPAGWYLGCGTIVLILAGRAGVPSPWLMGVPFGIGQLLVAWTLRQAGKQ